MTSYPYRQFPHRFAGSCSERQAVGDPGHCEPCVSVGHLVAHPALGCGDVGCDSAHAGDASARPVLVIPTESPFDAHERGVREGRAAALNDLLADLAERGFSIALWQGHERNAIRKWIEAAARGERWSRPVPPKCDALIWPSWANRWIRCGSPISTAGACARYGHRPKHPEEKT